MSVWSKIAGTVKAAAPLLGAVLGGPAGAAAAKLIAGSLGVVATPSAIERALAADPNAMIELKRLENDHSEALQSLRVEAEKNEMAAEAAAMREVNRTYRTELKSDSKFVRGWRPMFGYCVAFSWVILWVLVGVVAIGGEDATSSEIIGEVLSGAAWLWGMAMPVLGISAHQRSRDKRTAAGMKPQSPIDMIRGIAK